MPAPPAAAGSNCGGVQVPTRLALVVKFARTAVRLALGRIGPPTATAVCTGSAEFSTHELAASWESATLVTRVRVTFVLRTM